MLMLINRDEKLIASLKYKNIERKKELNGLNTLELECKREVEEGQRLLFKDKEGLWNEYIIFDYFKNHDKEGVTYSVYAEDVTSELYWFYVDDLKPRNETASSLLGRILEGTRFEVGYVDNFPKKSFNLYRTNVKACLWKMLEEYGAEINVRIIVDNEKGIVHRYIDLRNRIGKDLGKRFTYKKDMDSVKKTTSVKDLVTALYGYGKGEEIVKEDGTPSRNENKIGGGDYGRKIDFAEVNNGKKYVANEEARLLYGIGKERKHKFGTVEFSDCEDKRELLDLTREKLKEVSKPKISYELKVEDISRYEGYIGEGVGLGDIVIVDDKEIDTLVQTRVIAIKDNPLEEIEDSEIVLGNFIKDLSDNQISYEKLRSAFENDRNRFNDELNKLSNGIKTSYMQTVLDKFNKELNETGGWVYAEEGEGLLILNAPKDGNPTQAINLKGGKIAIANHKNADGSFAYETFGDGDGFTANLIRAGILKGGRVFFNLEDGTFLIGESRSNYSMYWDGSVLHMRNVDIDLENNKTIQNIQNNQSITNQSLEARKEEIEKAKQAIEDANKLIENTEKKWNKNLDDTQSVLMKMNDEVYTDLSNYKTDINKELLDIKSSVKITDEKISTSVESLNKIIETKDKDIKTYISKNYSSITQTDEKIQTSIESISKNVDEKDSELRAYLYKNYSSISQTESFITSSVSSQIKIVNDKIDSKDSSLRSYVQNNYSTKTQTTNLIESRVSSVSNSVSSLRSRVSNAESLIKQTANGLSSKVSKDEFGTEVRQSARDIKIAWNNYSDYIQFEYGSIGIYNNGVSESRKRAMFDENGIHFYRDGTYIGKIGTNKWTGNESHKGLVFDLEYITSYMCWAAKESVSSDYMMKWSYCNTSFGNMSRDTLYAGCDIDMRGYRLKNVAFEGGGISGTLRFEQPLIMDKDGTVRRWSSCTLRFSNGILIGGNWGS